jgi:hypothetical protein
VEETLGSLLLVLIGVVVSRLNVGAKSVLFGAHQFLLHPLFVAAAWTKLYGFPRDPRLWVAFFVHDLGYLFCKDMDGQDGEQHPFFGARLMTHLFDSGQLEPYKRGQRYIFLGRWGEFSLFHSRFLAKHSGHPYSKLCVADKFATTLEPWWLYLPRVIATGEIKEYMAKASGRPGSKYVGEPNTETEERLVKSNNKREWFRGMTSYLRRWVDEHRDGNPDTWTPGKGER